MVHFVKAKEEIVMVDILELPCANVQVFKNGSPIQFNAEHHNYGMYLDDDTYKEPECNYRIVLDMNDLCVGDVIICKFNRGSLQCDGGGENMQNIIGVINNYTVGMGTVDTQDIEGNVGEKELYLPYELYGLHKDGFEIHIIADPKKFDSKKYFYQIYFIVACEPGATDESWNLISFVTS